MDICCPLSVVRLIAWAAGTAFQASTCVKLPLLIKEKPAQTDLITSGGWGCLPAEALAEEGGNHGCAIPARSVGGWHHMSWYRVIGEGSKDRNSERCPFLIKVIPWKDSILKTTEDRMPRTEHRMPVFLFLLPGRSTRTSRTRSDPDGWPWLPDRCRQRGPLPWW